MDNNKKQYNSSDVMVRTQLASTVYFPKEEKNRKRSSFDLFNNSLLISLYSYDVSASKFNKKKDRSFAINLNRAGDLITLLSMAKEAYTKKRVTTYVVSNKKSAFGISIFDKDGLMIPCLMIFDCNEGMIIEKSRTIMPFNHSDYATVKEFKEDGVLADIPRADEFITFVDSMINKLQDIIDGRSLTYSKHMTNYGKAIYEGNNNNNTYEPASSSEGEATSDDSDEFPF